jgi:hypothetical protein
VALCGNGHSKCGVACCGDAALQPLAPQPGAMRVTLANGGLRTPRGSRGAEPRPTAAETESDFLADESAAGASSRAHAAIVLLGYWLSTHERFVARLGPLQKLLLAIVESVCVVVALVRTRPQRLRSHRAR